MNDKNVVEQVQFRIKDSVSESEFITLNENLNKWVIEQPGFLYRSLTKSTDGLWIDIVYWKNMESAQNAQSTFSESPECHAVMQAIVEESIIMTHSAVVVQIGYDA